MAENDVGNFEHYIPKHPLPDEIRSMRRDSTVCKYCGVSYLIHNEIKMLEDKLKVCEQELDHLRGCDQREKELSEKLTALDEKMVTELTRRDKLLNSLKEELRDTQHKLTNTEDAKTSLETQLEKTTADIETLRLVLGKKDDLSKVCQSELKKLQTLYTDMKSFVTTNILQLETMADENVRNCADRYTNYITDVLKQNDCVTLKNSEHIKQLKMCQNDIERLNAEIGVIENKRIQLEVKSQHFEKLIQEKTIDLESLVKKNRTLAMEADQYQQIVKTKSVEVDGLAAKLNTTKQQHEADTKLLNEQIKKQASENSCFLKEIEDWKTKVTQIDEANEEIRRRNCLTSSEISDLKSNLDKATKEIEVLHNEREVSIHAHQTQISDLRESFKNKMAEMNLWPEKLDAALNEERRKHNIAMEQLKTELSSSSDEEMKILLKKHDELVKKYQLDISDKNNKYLLEINTLKSKLETESSNWKKLLTESQERNKTTEFNFKSENDSLKNIIKSLEAQIASIGTDIRLNTQVEAKQFLSVKQELENLTSEHTRLLEDLNKSKEEIESLQETVRRECEERFELTEALSAAREEVLSSKRIPGRIINKQDITPRISSSSRLSNASTNLSHHANLSPENHAGNSNKSSAPLKNSDKSPTAIVSTNSPSTVISPSNINLKPFSSDNSFVKSQNSHSHVNEINNNTNPTEKRTDSLTAKSAKSSSITGTNSDWEVTVGKGKTVTKSKSNSIAQHRRRIAALLGKK